MGFLERKRRGDQIAVRLLHEEIAEGLVSTQLLAAQRIDAQAKGEEEKGKERAHAQGVGAPL